MTAQAAEDKKARDVIILDMRKISDIADFFMICSGSSTRQVKAISDHIVEKLEKSGQKVWHVEGHHHALWVLLDCGDVVVHIFEGRTREFYNLERLWGDAPIITLKSNEKKQ